MAVSTEQGTKDRTLCAVVTVIMLFVAMACLNSYRGVDFPRIIREFHEDWTSPNLPIPSKELPDNPRASPKTSEGEILRKLKELSRLASGGQDYSLTAAEREAWHTENPCQSRSELPAIYAARKHVKDISRNSKWDQVLDEYSNLHRICMQRVGNVSEHFLNKSNFSIPGCKFLVGEGGNGLGNKLLVTVSAVLYGIATQRILLMPLRINLKPLLCEPFVGSSWMIPEADSSVAPDYGNLNTSWEEDREFIQNMYARLELMKKEESSGESWNRMKIEARYSPPVVDAVVVSSGWDQWQPRDWFYCITEQKFLSEVPWVYMSGCLYSIPKIFGSPSFRTSLKALFPDNMVTTRLLRSVLLPSDTVWSRFKHVNHAYFHQADRRVAIQMRFYQNSHENLKDLVNNRVLDCVLKTGILPNVSETTLTSNSTVVGRESPSSAAPITTVFIASLYSDLHDTLSDFYLRSPTVSGEDVNLVQVTNHLYQAFGVEEDTEAFVEVLLLSASDVLLDTPASTFGGLAHTYGGLTPWHINTLNGSTTASCERSQSVDDCQVGGATTNFYCVNDPETAKSEPTTQLDAAPAPAPALEEEPPILGLCYFFDYLAGVQVLTNVSAT